MTAAPKFSYKELPCEAGGEHDWDLGGMGPGVALMYCTKCDLSVHMKAGRKNRYTRSSVRVPERS